jgi:3-oxoacyl-[acyl-carrier protein] reductase
MSGLENRVVLVTGGSRGIGAGIVRVLLEKGADVILHYGRGKAEAEAIAAAAPKGRIHLVQADLFDPKAPLALWDGALAWKGRVDVLVNNAGIRATCGLDESFEALEKAWGDSMRVNAIAPAHLCRLAIAEWKKRDAGKDAAARAGGIIVNISSRPAFRGDRPHFYHDGASKAAITALTYGLARFEAEHKITAFAVVPGIIWTEQMEEYKKHYDVSEALAEIPLKEFGTPEDVGRIVAFLATGEARYSTGSTIDVGGASYIH